MGAFVSLTTYHQRLMYCRKVSGLSREAAAKALGISEHQLYEYEEGIRELDTDVFLKMLEVYQVDCKSLIGVNEGKVMSAMTSEQKRFIAAYKAYCTVIHQKKTDKLFGNEFSDEYYGNKIKEYMQMYLK